MINVLVISPSDVISNDPTVFRKVTVLIINHSDEALS